MDFIKKQFSLFIMFTMMFVSACLPVQKETQCGNNEAFNATQRKCVPVIGSASTNTVFIKSKTPTNSYTLTLGDNPVEHSVSVSDVYNFGYSTQWNLRFTSSVSSVYNFSSDAVSTNTLTYNFLPPTASTPNLAGSYVIECVVLDQDGGTQLDSVSWTVQVGAQATPQLVNPSPASSAVTFPSNDTSETFTMDIQNDDSQTGIYTWYVNSIAVSGPTTFLGSPNPFPLTYTLDPANDLGSGIHTVELIITQLTDPTVIYDTHIWIVNVVDPDLPTISSASPAFSNTLINIDGVDYASFGYLDQSYTTLNSLSPAGLCVTVDDYDKDGDGTSDLDYSMDINGQIIASSLDYGSNQVCVTSALVAQNLVSDQVGESRTVTFKTFKKGTSTLVEQKQWALSVLPKNSTPKISARDDGTHTLDCVGLTDEALNVTGCELTQSVDANGDGDYTVGADDTDNTARVVINVKDFETYSVGASTTHGEDNIEVIFQIKKSTESSYQDLDGTSALSVNDCYQESGTAKTAGSATPSSGYDTVYVCEVGVNAFNTTTNEPIEAGTYNLKAFVRDAGSSFAPGNIQESNQVSWTIAVEEVRTDATVQTQVTTTSQINSYVEVSDATCTVSGAVLDTSTATVSENDYIKVHTIVKDNERDNLQISLRMTNGVSGGESFVVPLNDVTASYSVPAGESTGYVDIESCFKIPEWAVDGSAATSGTVNIIADIIEITDSLTVDNSTTDGTFTIVVNNDNPVPQFADSTDVTLSPSDSALTAGSDIIVFSGYPFEVDPPVYTDASVIDGDNVTWQWQYCIGTIAACAPNENYTSGNTNPNGSWVSISNANDTGNSSSENITWTPNPRIPAGTNVHLRICLGDDGGNPNDCSSASSGTFAGSFKVYQNIKAFPAQLDVAGYSGNELATWYDETNDTLYHATTSGTTIRVQKFQRSSTAGEKQIEEVHEIAFNSEEPAKTSDIPTQLSMSGIDGSSLYVAYKVTDQVTSAPQVRVRRIDISDDKLSFNYGGLFNGSGDSNDMVSSEPADGNTSLSTTGNADLIVSFAGHSGAVPADSITFNMADGTTAVVNYCAGSCVDNITAASDLQTQLLANNSIAEEFDISVSGTSVTIDGPANGDYSDFGGISVNIGQIVIDTANDRWYVPYAATSSLNLYFGGNASLDMTNFVASSQPVAGAGSVNQEVASAIDSSGNVIIGSKNSSGNLNVFRVDSSFSLVDNVSNVFTFTGSEEIYGISISSGLNDDVYIACINQNNVTGLEYLSAAVFDGGGIASYAATTTFSSSNYLAQPGIEEVKIVGHPSEDGIAILAITTNADHRATSASADGSGIPREAHLFRLINGDPVSFSSDPVLGAYNSSTTNLTSPALNENPTIDLNSTSLGSISVTPIFNFLVGHTDSTSTAGTEDSTEPVMWFSFHENNPGTGTRIIHGMYNIDAENMSTDASSVDDTQNGNFPSFVEN